MESGERDDPPQGGTNLSKYNEVLYLAFERNGKRGRGSRGKTPRGEVEGGRGNSCWG